MSSVRNNLNDTFHNSLKSLLEVVIVIENTTLCASSCCVNKLAQTSDEPILPFQFRYDIDEIRDIISVCYFLALRLRAIRKAIPWFCKLSEISLIYENVSVQAIVYL